MKCTSGATDVASGESTAAAPAMEKSRKVSAQRWQTQKSYHEDEGAVRGAGTMN